MCGERGGLMKINALIIVALNGILVLPASAQEWQTPGKWHRTLRRVVSGTLLIDGDGVEFRSVMFTQRWPFAEIRSFDLSQRDLTLRTYERRQWHEPGQRPFHFTLNDPMPPEVAARFTERVGRPVRNGEPLAL